MVKVRQDGSAMNQAMEIFGNTKPTWGTSQPKPEALPDPQDGALHVAATPDGKYVLVYAPGIMLQFDPENQIGPFIALLTEAQNKALQQRRTLKTINEQDPPTWDIERYRKS
jgi:hypothetical protein